MSRAIAVIVSLLGTACATPPATEPRGATVVPIEAPAKTSGGGEPAPTSIAAPDAAPDLSGPCKDRIDSWVAAAADAARTTLTVRSCSPPCRRTLAAVCYSKVSGNAVQTLSFAQTTASETGITIAAWEPQIDGTIRFEIECQED